MTSLGPVLCFRGVHQTVWCLSAIVVADADPGPLEWQAGTTRDAVLAEEIHRLGEQRVWRFQFELPLTVDEATASYAIGGVERRIYLPRAAANPRCFYASCNGFSSLKIMKAVREKNALWKEMSRRHAASPANLLLFGGDQVYADSMWETVPTMKAWNELSFEEGNRHPLTPEMESELEAFYFELYCQRWAQPEVAEMLATLPMIAMWDDHDIIDGWGSYPPERQNCPVFQGIFAAAKRAFAVFQQQLNADGTEPPHESVGGRSAFTRGHIVGRTAILALDMRSERTADQVLSPDHWTDVYAWMDGLRDVDHLLLMSSIPVVYPGFDTIEQILGIVPGQQDLEDDLRDHWNSRPHKGERLRLIHRLLKLADVQGIRPTILSGDVHVAAVGVIESGRTGSSGNEATVNQLISSGIVHPGPPAVMLFALRYMFDSSDEVDRGIIARMTKFPGLSHRFIGARNFMSLEPDEDHRFWANWIVEGEEHPYTKVVHALPRSAMASEGV